MPRVSVIVPTHKPSKHLYEALESVCQQSYSDWELLVVADGVEHGIDEIEREFPNARILRQPSSGVSVARNTGIQSAVGDFIAFLDHDDLWLPDKLRLQVEVMDEFPATALCFNRLECFSGTPAIRRAGTVPTEAPVLIHLNERDEAVSRTYASIRLFKHKFSVPSTVMVRRSCLSTVGLLEPNLPFTGDFDLLIRLGATFPVAELCSVQTLYRVHQENFSKQYDVCQSEIVQLVQRYQKLAKSNGDNQLFRDAHKLFALPARTYASHAFDLARAAFRKRELAECAHHLAQAVKFDPIFMLTSTISHFRR